MQKYHYDFIRLAFPDRTNKIEDIAAIVGYTVGSVRHVACDDLKVYRDKYLPWTNEFFFSNWSHDMAYVLGFVVADGNVQQDRDCLDIAIHTKDRCVLEFIRDKISPQTEIKKCKPGKKPPYKDQVRLSLYSDQIKRDLLNYGVVPAKTGREILPDIPSEYFGDFIRGLFDGDGHAGDDAVSIVSSCLTFVQQIRQRIGYGYIQPRLDKRTGHYTYDWIVYSKHQRQLFLDLMYCNGSEFGLDRKKNRIIECAEYRLASAEKRAIDSFKNHSEGWSIEDTIVGESAQLSMAV